MPLVPRDPRLGNQRQKNTQQMLMEMAMRAGQQRANFSRFAGTGSPRGTTASNRPFASGQRMFGQGAPARAFGGSVYDEAGPGGQRRGAPAWSAVGENTPRVGDENAAGLSLDFPGQGNGPPADPGQQSIASLFGQNRANQTQMSPALTDYLAQQRANTPLVSQASQLAARPATPYQGGAIQGVLGAQSSPSSPIGIGGMVPLGGGAWYDPASGQLYGAGGNLGVM